MAQKNLVISGASRGIGLELTRQALELGYTVAAGVRSPAKADALHGLAQKNKQLSILLLDVLSEQSAHDFAQALPRECGIEHIDILINNAGIYIDGGASFTKLDPSLVLKTFDTNSVGPLRVTQALLPLLKRSTSPKVVNISSSMGSIGEDTGGASYAYRMSKTALNMLSKNLSLDESQLTVLAMHPGWVKTDMGGAGAQIEASVSAKGLLEVITKAKHSDSGHFFDYRGHELKW